MRHVVGPGHKLALLVAVATTLALGALAGVGWAAGPAHVWRLLAHPHWIWFPVAFGSELLAYLGYTFAYREVARAEDGAELEAPHAAALVAVGFGAFLQGGGFSLDREALKRSGLSARKARARVLSLGSLEYAVLAPATAVAAGLVFVRQSDVSASLTLPWIIAVPTGCALALVALRFRRRLERRSGWRAALGRFLSALRLVLRILVTPRKHGLALAGITLYWLGDIACLWATLHLFYAKPPPVAQLIVGYATGYALTRRALPLGGAGIVESLLPFALGWVGIALPQALLAVVAYRLFNLWLPMAPALAAIPQLARLEAAAR